MEAWSPGCEGIYLAGAQSQGSIGLLRRLTTTWKGTDSWDSQILAAAARAISVASRSTARRDTRSDELCVVTREGKAS